MYREPVLFKGGIAVDDRGEVGFVNEFDFEGVRRFYSVENHQQGFVRAWHGHKKEAKYVHVVSGAALLAAVEIDNWDAPSRAAKAHRFVLSEKTPAVLFIPAGFANGFKSLAPNTKIMFFSTASIAESLDDDFRFDSRYWDPWQIEER